jgi:hypothetical protein
MLYVSVGATDPSNLASLITYTLSVKNGPSIDQPTSLPLYYKLYLTSNHIITYISTYYTA